MAAGCSPPMVARISSWRFLWPFVGFTPHLWLSESPFGAYGCNRFSWRVWRQKLCDLLLPMATEISNWSPSWQRLQMEISIATCGIFHQLEAWQKPLHERLRDRLLPLGVGISIWNSWEQTLLMEAVAVLTAAPSGDRSIAAFNWGSGKRTVSRC